MKPTKIKDILDLTYNINKMGGKFNPLFVGPAGLGKSEIVQQWCNEKGVPFLDLRAAYLEAPDVIGFPKVKEVNGRDVLSYATPEYWPTEGEGVIFLDEVNRANTSVMNTFMQLLTDRRIHKYELPKGWFIVSAVNPETAENDVNTMDAALRNRFSSFEVEFDKETFLTYMKEQDYDKSLVQFIESGLWQYLKPEDVGNKPGDKYISPRSVSKINSVLKAGFNSNDEVMLFESELGKNYAAAFFKFRHDERPVSFRDLLNNKEAALLRLKTFSDPNNYKNAQISVTIKDIVEEARITDELLAEVILTIPADQGFVLLRELSTKNKDTKLLDRICDDYKAVHKYLKTTLKGST